MQGGPLFSIDAMFVYCAVTIAYASLVEQEIMRTDEAQQKAEPNPNEVEEEEVMAEDGFRMKLSRSIDRLLLPLVSRFILASEMDPMSISDARRTFWIPSPFPPAAYVEFTYSFSSGSLYYLSELERQGPVIIGYKDKVFTVDANIAFDSLLFSCDYFLRLSFLRQHGTAFAEATSIRVSVRLDFNIANCGFTLRRLRLNGIESIRIYPVENGLVERSVAPVANVAILFMKKALIEKIEEHAVSLLREYFERTSETLCFGAVFQLLAYYL